MTKYRTLFLSGNGSNILTTTGFLKGIEDRIDRVERWNVCGNSSLIVFLKIAGYNYEQILDILGKFSLTSTFVNGSSLIPENEDAKKSYVKDWLIGHLSNSEFFSKDIKLDEIFKKTKIFPSFILFSRKKKTIVRVNPETHPKYKLVDCVLASLCYIGVYEEYSFSGDVYTNLCSVNCYPLSTIDETDDVLCIGNICEFESRSSGIFGPLSKLEAMFIRQFSEYEKYTIDKIFENIDGKDCVKLYSFYRQGKLSVEETKTLFNLGSEQAIAFKENEDTKVRASKFIKDIKDQE